MKSIILGVYDDLILNKNQVSHKVSLFDCFSNENARSLNNFRRSCFLTCSMQFILMDNLQLKVNH